MKIATAIVTSTREPDVAARLAEQVQAGLSGEPVDFCVAFASAHFEDELPALAEQIQETLSPGKFIGMTAETAIGAELEYENQPALVLWAARLPNVHIAAFHLSEANLQQLDSDEAVGEYLDVPAGSQPFFVLLADPFSFNPTPTLLTLLDRLHDAYPGQPALGGFASAGEEPGQNRLIFEGQTLKHGLVGAALWGDLEIETVVSQGCRPIGRHMVVTRADGNVIYELGGRTPLAVLRQLLAEIEPRDRSLVQRRGLLVGCAVDEARQAFTPGDFLIRNPIGFEESSGAIAINDLVRIGQTVQFQVRDGAAASEDLETAVAGVQRPNAGALLFTCNSRGTRLFKFPHHDARLVRDACGSTAVAGCSCAGEIGPVARRNYIHGHTASIGFFRPTPPTPRG